MREVSPTNRPRSGRILSLPLVLAVGAVVTTAGLKVLAPWIHDGNKDVADLAGTVLVVWLACATFYYFIMATRARNALDRRALQLETVLESMSHGLAKFNANGELQLWNNRFIAMYGLDAKDIRQGMTLQDILAVKKRLGMFNGDIDGFMVDMRTQMAASGSAHFVFALPSGRSISITRQAMADGGWVTLHDDITTQVDLTKRLDESKRFLEYVIDNIPSSVVVKRASDSNYLLVNRAFEKNTGLKRENVIGKTAGEFYNPEMAAFIAETERKAFAEDGIYTTERTTEGATGEQRVSRVSRFVTSRR